MLTKNKEGQDKFDVKKMMKALGPEWKAMSESEKKVSKI